MRSLQIARRAATHAALSLLALLALHQPGLAAGSRPNVLILVTDDQRPDTIHALGCGPIRTPNLDRLAARGTSFTRAVSPNPLCVPSRAEILTGCTGFRNGVFPPFQARPDLDLVTWPEAMRRAGYRTAHAGKWHLAGRPSTRGFDECPGLFAASNTVPPPGRDDQGQEITGYVGWTFQDDAGKSYPGRGVGLTPDINARFADAAIEWIGRPSDRPFFLCVNFTGPHDPLLRPPGFERAYDPSRLPLPANFRPEHPFDHGNLRGRDELLWPWPRTPETVREGLSLYYAVISHIDQQVGRIVAALEASGQADNTIIVFTSDHGLAIGSHGLRGKQNLYEHSVGVPMILAGPGILPNRRSDATIYLRDLYPTTCDIAGVPIPPTVEARSLAPVLRGEAEPPHDPAFGYFADTQRMIRDGRWKLIRYPKAGRTQLFDLSRDPDELDDLSDDPGAAAERARLSDALDDWRRRMGDPLLRDTPGGV